MKTYERKNSNGKTELAYSYVSQPMLTIAKKHCGGIFPLEKSSAEQMFDAFFINFTLKQRNDSLAEAVSYNYK